MAKATLATNFKDDILNSSMGNKRRYNLIQNSDGTVSLEDVSTYDQVGSEYGAGQVNSQNKAINESADAGKIIDDVDDIEAVTEGGYIAGALALKEVNSNLGGFTPIIDSSTGKITGYKTKVGADTVFPFNSKAIKISAELELHDKNGGMYAITATVNIAALYTDYKNITLDNIILALPNNAVWVHGNGFDYIYNYSYDATNGVITVTGQGNYAAAFSSTGSFLIDVVIIK